MKKFVKKIVATLCCLTTLFSLGACQNNVISAYDIAVQNGFVGTEEEWLLSLRGKNGDDGQDLDAKALYETAKKEGFLGTFLDFCKELGIVATTENDTQAIAKNMMSVVSIYCGFTKTVKGWMGQTATKHYASAGSGVIIELNKSAGSALIVTNYHVVYDVAASTPNGISNSVWVYPHGAYNGFSGSETKEYGDSIGDGIKATFVGGAIDYDVALLKIEGNELLQKSDVTVAEIATKDYVTVGEKVYAIGNPEGAGIAVTQGIISVDSEYIDMSALDDRDTNKDGKVDNVSFRVMRTDAAINGGNSGGGLFNGEGKLIGIVNAKQVATETDNMGYALPMYQVKRLCDNILAGNGTAKLARLGVTVSLTDSKALMDEHGQVRVKEEFAVASIVGESSSAYGKLNVGDVFLTAKVNDGEEKTFTREYQLNEVLLSVRKGDKLSLKVKNSNGQERNVEIVFDKDEYFITL